MYDYLVVGSGLYGAVFAHKAKRHGKTGEWWKNACMLQEMSLQRTLRALISIGSTPITEKSGNIHQMRLLHMICAIKA